MLPHHFGIPSPELTVLQEVSAPKGHYGAKQSGKERFGHRGGRS